MKQEKYLLPFGENKKYQLGQSIKVFFNLADNRNSSKTVEYGSLARNKIDKKAYLFTFDLLMALTLSFSILLVSVFFLTKGSDTTASDYQSLQVGSDIVTILDQNKILDTFDYEQIEIELEKLLPANYEMLLRVEGDFTEGNGLIEVGGEIPENQPLVSGEKVGLTDSGTLLKITYFVWVKE